jgi:hypothetical protein
MGLYVESMACVTMASGKKTAAWTRGTKYVFFKYLPMVLFEKISEENSYNNNR